MLHPSLMITYTSLACCGEFPPSCPSEECTPIRPGYRSTMPTYPVSEDHHGCVLVTQAIAFN
jgi:hypothetical protein